MCNHSAAFELLCCRQKQLDHSESRSSAQRGELSTVRETQQQGEVERQLLEREKAQLSEALSRVRKDSSLVWISMYFFLMLSMSFCVPLIVPPGRKQ